MGLTDLAWDTRLEAACTAYDDHFRSMDLSNIPRWRGRLEALSGELVEAALLWNHARAAYRKGIDALGIADAPPPPAPRAGEERATNG